MHLILFVSCCNQVEQVAQLATFSEALLEYHQQCTEILRTLTETLLEK